MERDYEGGEFQLHRAITPPVESAALDIIRTETVLSRLPVHNLSKQGSINIQILKKADAGEIELLWKVSPSRDYGEPRQLAYKLDTIIINQRLDEAGRPLPKLLRLGSLNDICRELGVEHLGGKSKVEIKQAFFQNVGALITAKFNYKANDRSERRLEAAFTRYSVIFTGEKLPDGRKADAVYIILNEPFWEVLNNAPVRPLDRAYMKTLPPAAQRFYEIISYKMFSALKNNYPSAKLSYSEYCTYSAQIRHYDRQRVQDQMAKVLRPHKQSGYINSVKYKSVIDDENKPDWELYLTPGPRAHDEFAIAHGRKPRKTIREAVVSRVGHEAQNPKPPREASNAIQPTLSINLALVSELTRRGITEKKATEIVAGLEPGRDLVAQLEYFDEMIKHAGFTITNPPGFYIRQIEKNLPVPDGFETSAKRKAREEREQKDRERRAAEDAKREIEDAYENHCYRAVEAYIEAYPAAYHAILQSKLVEEREKYPSGWSSMTASAAKFIARNEIRKQLNLPTFEEFASERRQGIDPSLKPVPPPDPLSADSDAPAVEAIAGDEPVDARTPREEPVAELAVAREAAIKPAPPETAAEPGDIPNLVSEPPQGSIFDGANDSAVVPDEPIIAPDPPQEGMEQGLG